MQRIAKSVEQRGRADPCYEPSRFWGGVWRRLETAGGLFLYVLSLGFCCKAYGESDFEEEAEEVLRDLTQDSAAVGEEVGQRFARMGKEYRPVADTQRSFREML